MKRVSLILIVFLALGRALATEQEPDLLHYDNNELHLYTSWGHPSPLETYYYQNNIRIPFTGFSTANYRGHVGVWEVSDDKLYLKEIVIEDYDPNAREFIYASYEPNEYGVVPNCCSPAEDGTVIADWFSGILDCSLIDQGSYNSYLFHVRDGNVIDMQIISGQDYDKISAGPNPSDSPETIEELRNKVRILKLNSNYITYYYRLNEDDAIEYMQQPFKLDTGYARLSPIFTLFDQEYYNAFKDANDTDPNDPAHWQYAWVNTETNSHLNWPYSWENTDKFGMPHCTWRIEDNMLYLTGLELYTDTSFYSIESEDVELTTLFKDKIQNGVVHADWVSGIYVIKHGYETNEYAGWPGYYFTIFNVTEYTYIRLEEGKVIESYSVPKDFDTENLPNDVDPGLRQVIEDYQLPSIYDV